MRIGELQIHRLGFGAMRVIDNDNIWGEPSDRKRFTGFPTPRRSPTLPILFREERH
jgi:hypothetical protein